MHRFYVPNIDLPITGAPGFGAAASTAAKRAISLDGPTARQLKTVLRAETGDRIRLFDGTGPEWEVEIDHVGKSEVSVKLIASVKPVAAVDDVVSAFESAGGVVQSSRKIEDWTATRITRAR